MLEIYLFGSPRVSRNGQPVVIQRRQTRTLLFYLAGQEKPESRLALSSLFWPDTPEDKSGLKLSVLLSKLRKDLDTDADIVITPNSNICLDWQKVKVDFLEYNQLLKNVLGPAGLHLPDPPRITVRQYQDMQAIVNLWNGNEFFAGYNMPSIEGLEHWRTQRVAQITNHLLAVLDRLGEYEYFNGEIESAIRWLMLATRLDQYNEERQLQILDSYLRLGKLSQARQYYEKVKKFWQVEARNQLPECLLEIESRISNAQPGKISASPGRWPIKLSTHIPYVGYREPLELFSRAWNAGGAILVLGEAGAGKTRLVQEAFQRLAPRPHLLLGSCHPLEANQPFAPWVSLLRTSIPSQTWQELDGIWAQSLSLLLPELATRRKDISAVFSQKPEIPRPVLGEAIHQVLRLLARQGPLFVFLDDTQWADEASLAVVSHLLDTQFFSAGRGLLVLAARLEERNPILDTLLVTKPARSIRSIQLSSLDLEEIGEVTRYMLGQPLSNVFLERLDRDTGGNPLFLIETLQSLLDTILPEELEQIESLPLPQSVHELLQRRLSALYPEAREIINTAALIGSQFSLELIENATHFIPDVLARAMDELEKARLLYPIPADVATYGFLHEKIRESVLIEISPARRRFLHQNIAKALEKMLAERQSPQAALLADHYEQAGNLPKAFHFWAMAASHAHRLASFTESLNAFERAERLIARTPGLTEKDFYNLYSTWNDALFQNDAPSALKRVNTALLALGEERQSPLLIGTALSGMSDAYMAENNFEAALKSVQDGLPYVRQSGNEYEMVRTLDRIGVYHYMLNRLPESQTYLQQSLEISKNSIDSLMVFQRCSTHYQLAITAVISGRPIEGLQYAQKTLEDAVRAYHPYGQVLAYSVMGLAHYLLGDFAEGRLACQKGMALEHIQAWRMLGYISGYYAMNAVEMGLLGEAWEFGHKAIEIGRRRGHGEVAGLGHKAIGDLYYRLGADSEALKSYQQGMSASGEHFIALENMHRYGCLLYRQGQTALGKEYLQRVLDLSEQSGLWGIHFLAGICDLEILSEERNYQQLEQRTGWFRDKSMLHLGYDLTRFTAVRLEMKRAFDDQDFETALELADSILPWYQQKNIIWRELECLQMIVNAQKTLGQASPPHAERLAALLQQVEDTLGNAPLAPTWQNCKVKILQT
ncbi:MAG: AAA family ATPase [Anaerolineales bacterium]|jgi:DNA-binding SARP family transcriptional activator|nr:AAA family ATPase [Anaerolineales bacterium]